MKQIVILLIAGCIVLNISYADVIEPTKQAFYAGYEVNVLEDKPLQQLLVPYHVYEKVKSQDLNDIRIFNSDDEIVPHRVVHQSKTSQSHTKELSFAKLTNRTDGLEKLIEKYSSAGIDVSLNLRALDADTSNTQADIYIGEVSEFKGNAREIELDWEMDESISTFFVADVDITEDFKHWKNIAKGMSLAQLKINQEIVKHNLVKIKDFDKKFFRVTIHGESRPAINKINLIIKHQHDYSYSLTKELLGRHDEDDKQIIYYTQPSMIIKKRLKILIPEDNVLGVCRVYSRDHDNENWVKRGSGTVYKMINNTELITNQEIDLIATSDRQWKLEVINSGSGFEQKPPKVQFLWQPHMLTFLARGERPFLLVYGSTNFALKSVSQNSFFDRSNYTEEQLIAAAEIYDEIKLLGGEDSLKENVINFTSKTIILWAVLIGGSILLLLMAFSLLKSNPKA